MERGDLVEELLRRRLGDDEQALRIAIEIYRAYKAKGRRGVREKVLSWLEEVGELVTDDSET